MKSNRKQFLQQGLAGLLGLVAAPQLMSAPSQGSPGKGLVVHAGEGETYWIGERNSPLTIKIARDRQGLASMCFCTEEIAPGEGVPIHKHANEDELIFIHTGEGVLTLGDEEIVVRRGSVALVPKNEWHGLKNTGLETLVMVFSYSPAGFEGYFRELGSPAGMPWQPKSPEEFARLDKKWGIVYK